MFLDRAKKGSHVNIGLSCLSGKLNPSSVFTDKSIRSRRTRRLADRILVVVPGLPLQFCMFPLEFTSPYVEPSASVRKPIVPDESVRVKRLG